MILSALLHSNSLSEALQLVEEFNRNSNTSATTCLACCVGLIAGACFGCKEMPQVHELNIKCPLFISRISNQLMEYRTNKNKNNADLKQEVDVYTKFSTLCATIVKRTESTIAMLLVDEDNDDKEGDERREIDHSLTVYESLEQFDIAVFEYWNSLYKYYVRFKHNYITIVVLLCCI